jgi:hypothetical protein
MTSIKKLSILLGTVFLIIIGISCNASNPSENNVEVSENSEIPLIYHMSFMSRYTKKLWFAGMAENWDLAYLYSHEIEEIGEDLIDGGYTHNDKPLADLLNVMLLPQIEEVEDAIKKRDRRLFEESYRNLIQNCNHCHVATDYGVVRVAIPTVNPFNQDFSVAE